MFTTGVDAVDAVDAAVAAIGVHGCFCGHSDFVDLQFPTSPMLLSVLQIHETAIDASA